MRQTVAPKQFGEIRGPYSDGGSYALYDCTACGRTFYGGNGTCEDPEGNVCIQCPYCTAMDKSYQDMWKQWGARWKPDNISVSPEIGLQPFYNPPREPASDPRYIKHVSCEDARFHVLSWDANGTLCSEKDCIINKTH